VSVDESPAPEIRILAGAPSPEEVAAVTAVLTGALDDLAGEHRHRRDRGRTAWAVSQRGVRKPLPWGAWRNVDG
jgi:hypothetical protein